MKREAKSAATAIASHGRAMARRSQASGRPLHPRSAVA